MGISGLLPLLKSATEHVSLSRFKGKLIAVDGNVWIHRGTYSCAMELAEGTPTEIRENAAVQAAYLGSG